MKAEYDFSKAERGKFYPPSATFKSPIYLDEDVQVFVKKMADKKGIDLNDVVNEVLRREMTLSKQN
ncbi:hypothetical protein SPB21_11830 [Leptothoe sp. ISB3NOV94-8A]